MHLTISFWGHEWIDVDLSRGPRYVLVDEDDLLDDGPSVVHNDSLQTSVDPDVDDYAVETVSAAKPARFGFSLPD